MNPSILCLFALLALRNNSTTQSQGLEEEKQEKELSQEEKENKVVQVIVQCNLDDEKEKKIQGLGRLKYRLPMMDAYVVELPSKHVTDLQLMDGVTKIEQDTHITAQMDRAKRTLNVGGKNVKGYTGKGVGVALIDSGIYPHDDFLYPNNRLIAFRDFVNGHTRPYDDNGHGTHVAGIIGGSGIYSGKKYEGIAPQCNLIGVKALDKEGGGNISDVLAAIQWVIDNRRRYNIRLINLSVGGKDKEGENATIVKGVNAAWDAGIIVIAAAGNNGPKPMSISTPGISRKIITVGSSDDQKQVSIHGDNISDYSGRGPTSDCIKKPDVVAPGADIISCGADLSYIPSGSSRRSTESVGYVEKSGTSMATPMVTGALALLLEKYPQITPNEVKLRLRESTIDLGYEQAHQGWGLLDVNKFLE